MATNRLTVDRRDYKSLVIAVDQGSLEYEFITSSSSRKILRSGLRQLWADEEPEEVAGSCDVIGKVISDCKRRLMYIQ
jgi:hypothetical protein